MSIKKCTEIGFSNFYPVISNRSVSIPKNPEEKRNRWEKIALSAASQSKQSNVATIHEIAPFEKTLTELSQNRSKDSCLILANELEINTHLKDYLQKHKAPSEIILIIGPEGGFDETEVTFATDLGGQSVSIASTILRTENAGFFTFSGVLFNYV